MRDPSSKKRDLSMTREEVVVKICSMGACTSALGWIDDLPDLSPKQLWVSCSEPAWMLWLAGRANVDLKLLVLIACDCARSVLHLVPDGEHRPRLAIEAAEAWCRGESTREQVLAASWASSADAADAKKLECADFVRARISWELIEKGMSNR
jgi:hypothetical protein